MSPHLKRWITAIVIVPALFTAIIYGPAILFAVIVTILVMGGVMEYNTMVFEKGARWEKAAGFVLGLFIIVSAYIGNSHVMFAMTTFSVMIAFLLFLYNAREGFVDLSVVAKVVFGLIYIPFMLSYIIMIRQWAFGVQWIFFIIFLAFSGDVSAYYVGKSMGKRKLMPAVSAGKTVEGTVGLVIGSIVGCLVYSVIFFHELSLIHVIVMAFLGSILGQLGDLCESTIKRFFSVKDSGFLFPGHGGVLDRLDSLIFIIPFVYYYRMLVIQ
ncbi:MAG: phosphatidate cytidylyltransferase [Deltaproteobacteria bacterium]|nr:phosphatidate cytidylyltransferase [Deltaproteobacteria bacterium]MBN2687888.1 phosphatidate cytidylyltransferase [Deltaproteobacteria bacterium]